MLNIFNSESALFVPFASELIVENIKYFNLSLAIFDKNDPRKIKWRLNYPIWNVPLELLDEIVAPIGIIKNNDYVYSFWKGKKRIFRFRHPILEQLLIASPKNTFVTLEKADHNPILSPDPNSDWESVGVLNPATLYDENEKKLHILYRAVGKDWRSVFGYATSNNGTHISSKSSTPCYVPKTSLEGQNVPYNLFSPYASGPGAGGCEDPRLTKNWEIWTSYKNRNWMASNLSRHILS